MKDNTVRISIMGGSGSGKTSFMGGLVQSLIVNAQRYGTQGESCNVMLRPEVSISYEGEDIFDDSNELTEYIVEGAKVANRLLDKYSISNRFKDATRTGGVDEYEFSLEINGCEGCRMIIADYPGEYVSSFGEHIDEYPKLAERLAKCDVIIVMADGVEISKNFGNTTSTRKSLGADSFNILFPMIAARVQNLNKKIDVIIAITKADSPQIAKQFKQDNFEDISEMLASSVYSNIHATCENNGWNFGIIPVSCVGENNVVTQSIKNEDGSVTHKDEVAQDADPKQENIDIAILYSLYNHIEDMIEYLESVMACLTRETKPFSHPAGYKKAEWERKIAECQSKIDRLKSCHAVLKKHTFSNLNRVIHQRLPKSALPTMI